MFLLLSGAEEKVEMSTTLKGVRRRPTHLSRYLCFSISHLLLCEKSPPCSASLFAVDLPQPPHVDAEDWRIHIMDHHERFLIPPGVCVEEHIEVRCWSGSVSNL